MIKDPTRSFVVDNVSLCWDRWGDRGDSTPFVLCHGFGGSAHDFALVIEELTTERDVVALDHRGHGRSQKLGTTDGYSMQRLADDLIALIDGEVGGPVDLLGHSMGGPIALMVTLARPDLVNSLILMDTTAWSFVPQDPALAEMIAGFLLSYDTADPLPDISVFGGPEQEMITSTTPADWQATKDSLSAGFDRFAFQQLGAEVFSKGTPWIRDRLAEITCPISVIVGEFDYPFIEQAETLAAEAAAHLTVIPGAYHSPQLTHRTDWLAAVAGHFARL